MFLCASCGSKHTEGTLCSACNQHFDFPCSGVTESGYRKLGDRKNTWRCPKCKSSLSLTPATSPATSPVPSQLDKIQEQLNKVMIQLTPLALLIEDVKTVKSEIKSLKDSQEMAHQLIGDFSATVQALDSRVGNIEKAVLDVSALQAEVSGLKQDLQDRDQWARANNVEIRGIPQSKNENLFQIVQKIGQVCNFAVRKEEINYIARIPTRVPNIEKPIVIAFNNRYTKEELVASSRRNKRLLSGLGFTAAGNFYVNDHLTQRNKALLNKARSLAKEKNFKYVWVKHCKIMARKSDTSPIFFIKCENDLMKIV